MSEIYVFSKKTQRPISFSSLEKDAGNKIANLSYLQKAIETIEREVGDVEVIGVDIFGEGNRELMVRMGNMVSAIYIGEKEEEIDPAYLRSVVKYIEDLISPNWEKVFLPSKSTVSVGKYKVMREKYEGLREGIKGMIKQGIGIENSEAIEWVKKTIKVDPIMTRKRREYEAGLSKVLIDLSSGIDLPEEWDEDSRYLRLKTKGMDAGIMYSEIKSLITEAYKRSIDEIISKQGKKSTNISDPKKINIYLKETKGKRSTRIIEISGELGQVKKKKK